VSPSLGMQGHSRCQVKRAVGAVAGSFMIDHDVTGKRPIKEFGDGRADAILHVSPQRLADVKILSGNPQRHDDPPCSFDAPVSPSSGERQRF